MDEKTIETKLDALAEIQAAIAQVNARRQVAIDVIMPIDLKEQVDAINEEFAAQNKAGLANALLLEAEIRTAVLALGKKVAGKFLQAVWAKGRTTWNTQALDGYLKAHPELQEFRKQGEPSVSIKAIH